MGNCQSEQQEKENSYALFDAPIGCIGKYCFSSITALWRAPKMDTVQSTHIVEEKGLLQGVNIPPNYTKNMADLQFLDCLGMGAYGQVFSAFDRTSGKLVAVKQLHILMENDKEEAIKEMNFLLNLGHPCIIKGLGVCSTRTNIYLIMEHGGRSLHHFINAFSPSIRRTTYFSTHKYPPFSLSKIKFVMTQLLCGLHYLHSVGVVHRDLKPSNLVLDDKLKLKICDLGMAKCVEACSGLVKDDNTVVSLPYRAPELLVGAKEYSFEIDMWSVGCIMAELLTNVRLFNGQTKRDQLSEILMVVGCPILPTQLMPILISNRIRSSKNRKIMEHNIERYFKWREDQGIGCTPFNLGGILSLHVVHQPISASGYDLLQKLLSLNPDGRPSAQNALNHPWLKE